MINFIIKHAGLKSSMLFVQLPVLEVINNVFLQHKGQFPSLHSAVK